MYMSAPILRWPRKLHAVSDDMESFVHVTGIMALRFCLHNCSPIETAADTDEMDLDQTRNEALSELIISRYLQSTPDTAHRYELGGREKLLALQTGHSGINFKHRNSPISALVKGFYTALKPFYSKIDWEEWDSWYATYSNEDPSESEGTSLDALDLVDHDILLDVFTRVLHSKTVNWESIPPKTPDQFKGLRDGNGEVMMKGTTAGTKRQPETGNGDDGSRKKSRV